MNIWTELVLSCLVCNICCVSSIVPFEEQFGKAKEPKANLPSAPVSICLVFNYAFVSSFNIFSSNSSAGSGREK